MSDPDPKKKKRNAIIVSISVAALVLLIAVLIVIIATNGSSSKKKRDIPSDYLVDHVDADEYFGSRAKVLSKTDASKSKNVHTEAEAYSNLKDRGFSQTAITADYSIKGKYIGDTEITTDSKVKHPVYQTYFVSSDESVWTIIETNGHIVAVPVSRNSGSGVDIIVSESESIFSYDSASNSFYEIIPNESSGTVVVTVPHIDSQTLDSMN